MRKKDVEYELKMQRTLIYRPEYVKIEKIKCVNCGQEAWATYYDEDWNALNLCRKCWEKY